MTARWNPTPAELVIGDLDAAAQRRGERLLADDPAYRVEVERLTAVASQVATVPAEAWPAPAAPPLRIDLPAREAPAAPPRRRLRDRLGSPVLVRPVFAASLAALLLGFGLAGGALLRGEDGVDAPTPDMEVALAPFGEGEAGERATVAMAVGDKAQAHLVADGLKPLPEGEYYELWLISQDGTRITSVGSFRAGEDGKADVVLPLAVDPRRYGLLDVSVEPDDGDPGHSKRSVLRAPLPS